jgi:hypothetical protein
MMKETELGEDAADTRLEQDVVLHGQAESSYNPGLESG